MIKHAYFLALCLATLALSGYPSRLRAADESLSWHTAARLHRTLRSTPGTLKVSASGIEFESPKGYSRRWPYLEIRTVDLFPHRLVIEGYLKRGRHLPGTDRYRFKLETSLPARVAAAIAQRVGRPVQNAVPLPKQESFAEIPAQHRTALGGTKSNGVLRFGPAGVDYVSPAHDDSRSWRWSDIQTLSNPDAYHLTVFGYRDTYSFNLKQPLKRPLCDRLSDLAFEHNLSDSSLYERTRP